MRCSSSILDAKPLSLTTGVLQMTSCFFVGGEGKSVAILYECLKLFDDSSGLNANASKSAVNLAGILEPSKGQIAELVQMPLGSLPFRYFGVPSLHRESLLLIVTLQLMR